VGAPPKCMRQHCANPVARLSIMLPARRQGSMRKEAETTRVGCISVMWSQDPWKQMHVKRRMRIKAVQNRGCCRLNSRAAKPVARLNIMLPACRQGSMCKRAETTRVGRISLMGLQDPRQQMH
jgi:hypothetical protein